MKLLGNYFLCVKGLDEMIKKYWRKCLYVKARFKHKFKVVALPVLIAILYFTQLLMYMKGKKYRGEWREWSNWMLLFYTDLKKTRPSLFSAEVRSKELTRQLGSHRPSSINRHENVDEFWSHLSKIQISAQKRVEKNQSSINGIGFVGNEITNSIGHMAEALSNRAKARELGLSKKTFIVISSQIINRHYLENYWSRYFSVVSVSPLTEASLELEHKDLFETINYLELNGEVRDNDVAHDLIENMWEQQNRKAILRTSAEDSEKAAEFLSKFGFKSGDKYVVLHLRTTIDNSARNIDTESYIPTIDYLCEIGYWVVRIGSRDTPRVKTRSKHFIDYSNSGLRSEVLDIALIANANFMIGCSSGPLWVANSFGVPLVWTNCTGLVRSQYFPNAILLPKVLRYKNSGQVAPLVDETSLSIYELDNPNVLDNFYYQDNSELEILETVKEFVNLTMVIRGNNETNLVAQTLEKHKGSKMTKLSKYFVDTYTESMMKMSQIPQI